MRVYVTVLLALQLMYPAQKLLFGDKIDGEDKIKKLSSFVAAAVSCSIFITGIVFVWLI